MKKALFLSLAISTMILLSLMTIGTPPTRAASEYKVYQLVQPTITSQYVHDIATNLFGITNPEVQEIDGLYFVNSSYPKYVEVYKVSGSIWYTDWSKMYNETYQPTLPSESQALNIADNFLTSHSLKPPEAYFSGFGNTTTEIMGPTNMSILNSIDVLYSFKTTDDMPIEGAGAKIRVSLGHGGELIGLHWVWRTLSTSTVHTAITETEAQDIYLRRFNWTLVELNKHVAYYAEQGSMAQSYLQPYYIFSGEIEIEGEQVSLLLDKVPATTFSPQALITSPAHNSKYASGDALTFTASASKGLLPYTYTWQSDVTGLLYQGSSPSFTAVLPIVKKGETLIPQSVTVTVTDSRGMNATDSVSVTVKPSGVGGICVPVDKFGVLLSWLTTPQFLAMVTLFAAVVVGFTWLKRKRKGVIGLFLISAIIAVSFVTAISIVNAHPNDDANKREHGVDTAINPGDSLFPRAWSSSNGFYTTLIGAGWTPRFRWIGPACWEEDYKYRTGLLGGTDYYNGPPNNFPWYCKDAVDFAYYVGHGSPWVITFPCGSRVDFPTFQFTNPNRNARWGGTEGGQAGEEADLEWMALESCNTLQWSAGGQNVFQRWWQAFQGLHYVLGFHTSAWATWNLGRLFAQRLTWGWTVRRAWIAATIIAQPGCVYAAYLRGGNLPWLGPTDTFWDRIPPWWVAPDPHNPVTNRPDFLAYLNWKC